MIKPETQLITEVSASLNKNDILPLYYLFGEDIHAVEWAVKEIEKAVEPLLSSDFDKETIDFEQAESVAQIIDNAYAFPFGSGKKLLIVKKIEKLKEIKELTPYFKSPAETTVLVFCHEGKISNLKREPYSLLTGKKYIFEAKKPKVWELAGWVQQISKKYDIDISVDNAGVLVEIVGEDKSLLEMHIRKFVSHLGAGGVVTFNLIKELASPTKEYSIFDLLNALGTGNKSKAVQVAFNILDSGGEILQIIAMVTKYITTVARAQEMVRAKISDEEAAKIIEVNKYFYQNCKSALRYFTDFRLLAASRALLKADLSIKTSTLDPKVVVLTLISEIANT